MGLRWGQGQSYLADVGMHNKAQRHCHRLLEAGPSLGRGEPSLVSRWVEVKLAKSSAWQG